MTNLAHQYRRNENFVFRNIEDETILVPIKNNVGDMGCIYNLNAVGAFIWEQLDGSKTLNDIAQLVTEKFEISLPEAQTDVEVFTGQLKEIDAVVAAYP